ncbi:ATP-binding protein [Streptomyces sp. AK02-01A]|uniref:ATP-binding protein n=1 Tax=Streptomyces sp. AK02-01A TaxID=3028648 RepID=UPI0029A7BF9A|nr:ATP-binding protein [Streptomyces sp. AK02-01A]MDX3853976.1 ATP-binding protein [Streptomyces sp. AK02-01A]
MNEQTINGPAFASIAPESVQPLRRAAEFSGEPGCAAEARLLAVRFLQQLEAEWFAALGDRTTGDLLLVVSELVTNAERHSHGPYLLELEGTDRQVTVTVYDSSSTLPRRYARDPGRLGGHGLEIVHALSDRLTAERVPVGKRVQAAFDLGRHRAGV